MFDYLVNEYNPAPQLTTACSPPAPGVLQRRLPYSTSLVVDLPRTVEELRSRQPRRYWHELARRERRFNEAHGPLVFRFSTDPDDLAEQLPEVRDLFARRWAQEYTSLPWKSVQGFAPYARAMTDLAGQGRGALAVLRGDGRLLSFGYCLLEPPWCYLYQHAASPEPEDRPYALGKMLIFRMLEALVTRGDVQHLDLMLGDAAYKREWESWRRPVELVLEEPATPTGALRLTARTTYHRARHYVQFENPRARALAKRALGAVRA